MLTRIVVSAAIVNYSSEFHSNESKKKKSVIIGTGIVGLTSAYYLARSGHQVICIERREDVGLETSYKNGAFMCSSQSIPWANTELPKKYLKNLFNFESNNTSQAKVWLSTYFSLRFYRWLIFYLKNCTKKAQEKNTKNLENLTRFSSKCLNEIVEDNSIEFSRSSLGSIILVKNEIMLKQISKSDGINDKIILNKNQLIEKENLLKQVKDDLYAGVYFPQSSNGNMYQFCCQLKKILIDKYNVQFIFNEQVEDFILSNVNKKHIDGIITNKQTRILSIDYIIVANGNFVMNLMKKLNIFIPVYPVKGYVVEIKVPKEIDVLSVNLIDLSTRVYITALKSKINDSLIRISGSVEFSGWKDIGQISDSSIPQSLYDKTMKLFPYLSKYEKEFHSCSRSMSADDLPLLGKLNQFDNLYLNVGHGSRGWRLAPGCADLLDKIINQNSTNQFNIQPFNPNRFSF